MNQTTSLICVVDDDDMVRESICMLATAHGYVSRGYATCQDFLNDQDRKHCDCLVLDVRLPGISGPELQEKLSADSLVPPIIFISGHGTVPQAVKAIQLGALDFLQKPFDEHALIERITQAVARSTHARRNNAQKSALLKRVSQLTNREKEVMGMLAQGLASKQIADRLGISTRTVEQYRANLKEKLGTRSLAEILLAYRATSTESD